MTMRILVKSGSSKEAKPTHDGMSVGPTTQHRGSPTVIVNDEGKREASVSPVEIEMLTIKLTSGIGDRTLFELWKMAAFTVIVVESIQVVGENGAAETRDVLETRYEKLKPVSLTRDHGANVVTLVCCTLSAPIVEVLKDGKGAKQSALR